MKMCTGFPPCSSSRIFSANTVAFEISFILPVKIIIIRLVLFILDRCWVRDQISPVSQSVEVFCLLDPMTSSDVQPPKFVLKSRVNSVLFWTLSSASCPSKFPKKDHNKSKEAKEAVQM